MKRLVLILSLWGASMSAAELAAVHSVYLLPMGSSLDQYLAIRLTSEHVFQVVTDPKLADAVFTDRIGFAFESRLADLLAVSAPAPAAQPAPSQPAASPAASPASPQSSTLITETVNKLSNPASSSSFGRGKGTIFLVDRKSKEVIWSVFEPPKGATGQQLDRGALDIVSRLKRDLKGNEGAKP
jgi:hypothetical protein